MDNSKNELFTVTAHSTAADDHVRTDDGALDCVVKAPKELGGPGGGVSPESLFAASFASCMHAAIALVASGQGVDTTESEVHATARIFSDGTGYLWNVALEAVIPGATEGVRTQIVDQAARICPITRSVDGNIEVTVSTR